MSAATQAPAPPHGRTKYGTSFTVTFDNMPIRLVRRPTAAREKAIMQIIIPMGVVPARNGPLTRTEQTFYSYLRTVGNNLPANGYPWGDTPAGEQRVSDRYPAFA